MYKACMTSTTNISNNFLFFFENSVAIRMDAKWICNEGGH